MKVKSNKFGIKLRLALLGGVTRLVIFSLVLLLGTAHAADHIDAPLVREDAKKDITDLFVFRSPADPSQLVLALNLFTPVGAPDSTQLFDSAENGTYAIFLDTDGDQVQEHTLKITFDDRAGEEQQFEISGIPGVGTLTGKVTASAIDLSVAKEGRVSAFAGLRDDPFFFDFEGFNAFLAAPCIPTAGLRCPGNGTPVDFFLGLNVASIVIELPLTNLSGIDSSGIGKIGVWAKTFSK